MQSQMNRNNHPGQCKELYKNNLFHKMAAMCAQLANKWKQMVDHRLQYNVTYKQLRCEQGECLKKTRGSQSWQYDVKSGQRHSLCVPELKVTGTDMKILSVAQQCSYGKFMSPTTTQSTRTSFWKKLCYKYFTLFSHVTQRRSTEGEKKKKELF